MCLEYNNSSICAIIVLYSKRVVKTRSEYSHLNCGVTCIVFGTFPSFLSGPYRIAYYDVGFVLSTWYFIEALLAST